MTLDFIAFINQNISLSAANKQAMLDDFVAQYRYPEFLDEEQQIPNPISKAEFANSKIEQFIRETVHAIRHRRANEATTIEDLDLT